MKRLLLVALGNLIVFSYLFAGDVIHVNPFVTLEINDNEYVVEYRSPYCEERDTTLNMRDGEYTFSHIVFGEDAETISRIYDMKETNIQDVNDLFDYMEGEGIPELPFMSLELQLPADAEINVEVSEIQYIDMNTGKSSAKKVLYKLNHDYMPSQLHLETEMAGNLQYDDNAYNDSVSNGLYRCSEQGGYLGTNGFTFSISPLLYTPSKRSIVPIAYAKYTISVTANNSLKRTTDTYAMDRNSSVSPEILSFYDNHRETTNRIISRANLGTYLIITTSKYVSTLAPFITHKQNLGYTVTVKTFTEGTNRTTIRNYLIGLGAQSGGFPKYTLIVGNHSDIPYSYDTLEQPADPPTDIYYACLEQSDISKEKNFKPETILGRWPVANSSALIRTMNRTISFENRTYITRRFCLFSGTGNGKVSFASDMRKAYNKLCDINNAQAVMYDGREGFTSNEMQIEFSNNDGLVFTFRGHGNYYQLGSPYTDVNSDNILIDQPYFSIGLACSLSTPTNDAFGSTWMNYGNRACGFYGATTESNRSSNSYLSKHIFDYLVDQESNLTWGSWISSAAAKYYSSLVNASRRQETEKYVIYGDPSLYVYGINPSTGSPLPYKANKHFENTLYNNIINLSSDEIIKNIVIFTTMGLVVSNKNVEEQMLVNDVLMSMLQQLQGGIYIVSVTTDKNHYTNQINVQ